MALVRVFFNGTKISYTYWLRLFGSPDRNIFETNGTSSKFIPQFPTEISEREMCLPFATELFGSYIVLKSFLIPFLILLYRMT